MDGPEAGAGKQQAGNSDVGGVEDLNQARAFGVVIRRPAQPSGLVLVPQRPVAEPPHLAVAIDGARAGDARIVLPVDIHQRRRPAHLDAGDSRRHDRIVLKLPRTDDGCALLDFEHRARLYENRSAEIRSRRDHHRSAARAGSGVKRRLDGPRIQRRPVALRAKISHAKIPGVGHGGNCEHCERKAGLIAGSLHGVSLALLMKTTGAPSGSSITSLDRLSPAGRAAEIGNRKNEAKGQGRCLLAGERG